MIRLKKAVLVAAGFFLGFGLCPPGARAAEESLNRRLPLKSAGRLTLQNTQGDIRISTWDQEAVELRVETSADSEDELALVPVDVEARDDEILVTSLYPVYAPELKVRVDYHLRVPREIDLRLIHSMNGDVDISGVSGRAVIEVGNGEIRVKGFSGILKATATNGRIEAEVNRIDETGHIALENYNGDILLRLPRNAQACSLVKTMNGHIDSSIPLDVDDDFGPEVARRNDREEPVIHLYSINGDIRIDER